jgi:hypothetical protein
MTLGKNEGKGMAAFDSSDSYEDGWYGEQVAWKPVANKKSKNVVKQRNASSKPLKMKTMSKSKKGCTGATKAASIKMTTTTKKRDCCKLSGNNHTVRNPPAVSKPG